MDKNKLIHFVSKNFRSNLHFFSKRTYIRMRPMPGGLHRRRNRLLRVRRLLSGETLLPRGRVLPSRLRGLRLWGLSGRKDRRRSKLRRRRRHDRRRRRLQRRETQSLLRQVDVSRQRRRKRQLRRVSQRFQGEEAHYLPYAYFIPQAHYIPLFH